MRIAGFGGLTGAMLPAFVAHQRMSAPEDRDAVRERWVEAWSSSLLTLFGVRVAVHGDVPPRRRGQLVVANHRSTADILILLRTFGGHIVSRADLARWPLVGPAAQAVGTLFVDRGNATSGATAVRLIRTRLALGATVIVFPEGTTFPDDEVRPFQAGSFVAALKSGADVVPAGLAYASGSGAAFVNETFPEHLARMAGAPPSRAVLTIGEPLRFDDGARAGEVRDLAFGEVQRLVRDARKRVDG
jgi:1-acyl-sn-glycerol-3-phosphate acyltransferase